MSSKSAQRHPLPVRRYQFEKQHGVSLTNSHQSRTCVALPHDLRPLPALFHPLAHAHLPDAICPTYDDRWDIRTGAFGCHISNVTFYATIIAVVATLLALPILRVVLGGLVGLGGWTGGSGWVMKRNEGGEGWTERDWKVWWMGGGTRWAKRWRAWRSEGSVEERRALMGIE